VKDLRITHVGGPTVLIETAGWTILTDPTFDAPGRRYSFGWGTASNKVVGPALAASALPALDAVLLSHDHHADNLDDAGRALLPDAGAVITTVAGEKRLQDQLGRSVRGLDPWRTTTLDAPGKPSIEITATPCRHGPPLSQPVAGHVIGFSLRWEGQEDGVLWISGDTVLYDGVRQVAERLDVDVAILHLGAVRFGLTGPIRYSMTAAEAVELCGELRPNTAVPVHYEGWSHFSQGRDGIDAALAAASADVRERFRLVPIGEAVDLSA
jgi:L-ascorbate metabolism protein UlaG (beta-lactamase superfamily)